MDRAGRHGERENDALEHGLAIAGWTGTTDLSASIERSDIREVV
ncbi:hypothetical protein ACYBSK_25555 [Streptomyces sp. BYX5S]